MKSTSFVIPKQLLDKALGKSYATGSSITSIVNKLLLMYCEDDLIIRNNNFKRNVSRGSGEIGVYNYLNDMTVYAPNGVRLSKELTVEEFSKYIKE